MTVKSERAGARPVGDAKPIGGDTGTFVPRKKYAAIFGICTRSAVRRKNEDRDFPQIFYINGRAYVTDSGLAEYQKILMSRGLAASAPGRNAKIASLQIEEAR
jgi:hypothetical protein